MAKKSKISKKEPKNPNCSAKTVKIKSVCFSGKNSKLLWVPCLKPYPKKPPDPIAILDWIIWYPDPNGSFSGFKKVSILCFW